MQFTVSHGTERSINEIEVTTGTQEHRILVRLDGFGLSLGVSGLWQRLHWEGFQLSSGAACGLFVWGPIELTGQVPAWATLKRRTTTV